MVAGFHSEEAIGWEAIGGVRREGHLDLLHPLDHVRGGDDHGFVTIEANDETGSPYRRVAAHTGDPHHGGDSFVELLCGSSSGEQEKQSQGGTGQHGRRG